MDDLVGQLRDAYERLRFESTNYVGWVLLDKAANELERLQADVAKPLKVKGGLLQLVDDYGNAAARWGQSSSGVFVSAYGGMYFGEMQALRVKLGSALIEADAAKGAKDD